MIWEKRNSRAQIIEKYFATGVYNLGTSYINTGVRMELLQLTKKHLNKIDIAIYKEQMLISGLKKGKTKMMYLLFLIDMLQSMKIILQD